MTTPKATPSRSRPRRPRASQRPSNRASRHPPRRNCHITGATGAERRRQRRIDPRRLRAGARAALFGGAGARGGAKREGRQRRRKRTGPVRGLATQPSGRASHRHDHRQGAHASHQPNQTRLQGNGGSRRCPAARQPGPGGLRRNPSTTSTSANAAATSGGTTGATGARREERDALRRCANAFRRTA